MKRGQVKKGHKSIWFREAIAKGQIMGPNSRMVKNKRGRVKRRFYR